MTKPITDEELALLRERLRIAEQNVSDLYRKTLEPAEKYDEILHDLREDEALNTEYLDTLRWYADAKHIYFKPGTFYDKCTYDSLPVFILNVTETVDEVETGKRARTVLAGRVGKPPQKDKCEHGILYEHATEYCPKCLRAAMAEDDSD